MARLKIADIARENEKVKEELKKTQIALVTLGLWLIVLSAFVFLA